MNVLSNMTTLRGGKYRILRPLGHGSFGVTYLATAKFVVKGTLGEMETEVKVAVKEFFMGDINTRAADGSSVEGSGGSVFANYRKKFRREAENLSKLNHPNIVKVLDVFDENNTTYYVMQYIEGMNLNDYIQKKGRLNETEALGIVKDMGKALSYMHRNRMLHLDIKPKNVMIENDGKAILIDFGLAKQYTANGDPESSTSIGMGTPGYAPIEQANYHQDGTFPVTLDIYAFGATIYKMLTGQTPPHASDLLEDGFPETMFRSLGVSEHIIGCVKKAMGPTKKSRYQSLDVMVGDIECDDVRSYSPLKKRGTIINAIKNVASAMNPLRGKRYENVDDSLSTTPVIVPDTMHSSETTYEDRDNQNFRSYEKAAKEGDANAQNNLGDCYYFGRGVQQDYAKAVYWYEKSAEQGKAYAQNSLGVCYYFGRGVQQDYAQAVFWYEKSAEQGDADAQFMLGVCYDLGQGVQQDYAKAVYWYEKSAEQGDANAQNNLGDCYYFGQGVKQDYAKAVYWYEKSAEQGNDAAQYSLGRCYYFGQGVQQDYAKAVFWYAKSAEQGNADAQYSLGLCYDLGDGVQQDYAKAVYWYEKSAEQGNTYAQNNLGDCYYLGQGVKQNYAKALSWYAKSAEQGNAAAQNNLGACYESGRGVQQDYVKAVSWYEKSAEQGNADAQYSLGYCYTFGQGVRQDYAKAVFWYAKSAEQGNAGAQYCLGTCYENGLGVKQDYSKAVSWYEKSAEQGNTYAQEQLSRLL